MSAFLIALTNCLFQNVLSFEDFFNGLEWCGSEIVFVFLYTVLCSTKEYLFVKVVAWTGGGDSFNNFDILIYE